MALDVKRFIARFVEEARDHLRRIDEGLGMLAADPADAETINAVFRSAHTIKGSSRMLKLTAITDTAHMIEDILGAMREGSLMPTPDLVRLLQRAIDAMAGQVEQVADGDEAQAADTSLHNALAAALGDGRGATVVPDATPETATQPAVDMAQGAEAVTAVVAGSVAASGGGPDTGAKAAEVRLRSAESVRVQLSKLDELIKLMGEVVSSHARLRQRLSDVRGIERDLVLGRAVEETVTERIRLFSRDLRDDVFTQDLLMDELHKKALIMRMLPLATVFEPAARMVRDLGRSLGKDVECVTSGMEIELDRQLIDRLSDPVVHLLRNAVDHGIEPPAVREAAGKTRHGCLTLSARQDGGFVVIEVRDDGNGLSVSAIRDKAIKKGLLTAEKAASLPESEITDMIFQPGFSTSAIITDVSGRGVGMDVVKRCVVDDLQGAISVDTQSGAGTSFSLRLPLSLAVMRVLLVGAGGQVFGFTAQYIAHLLDVSDDRIMVVAERRAVVIENEFIPVVALADLMGLSAPPRRQNDGVLLVVVQVGNEKLALIVDQLLDERDMVIKPLPDHLRQLVLVSGMVMTGKNELVGILQAPALMEAAQKQRGEGAGRVTADGAPSAEIRVLVVDDSLNTREIEKDVLEAHGYNVTLAEDGRDGLNKAMSADFDAILTDVEMPNMDGFTLTAALRREDRYKTIPIIIITSREKEEDKRRGIQVGADAYIVKGDFDQSSLVDTLKSLLG